MNSKYQIELDEFRSNFREYKDSQIVLYGIGRYTATLVEGLEEFHFTGLMDKDISNIGKELFGRPIISLEDAEKKADLIVINTSETYWDIIYQRIADSKIPVFYKNGQRAHLAEQNSFENPFSELNMEQLYERIRQAEVVSFDLFDTLFVRCVCNPRDVFQLIWQKYEARWSGALVYIEARNKAIEQLTEHYTLNELYKKIEEIAEIPEAFAEEIKEYEIELEKRLLVPREPVVNAFKYAVEQGKLVYIVSDMYLPTEFYQKVLVKQQIQLESERILVSGDVRGGKKDGKMWRHFLSILASDTKILHIGDNLEVDVQIPQSYGIDTYHTPSVWDLLRVSSLNKVNAQICNIYSSQIIGLMLQRLYQNPYTFQGENAQVVIQDEEDMGYVVFGPVILSFLLWILKQDNKKNVFMARDGYFLKEDFDYLCQIAGIRGESCYIGISRQLAMMAAIENDKDLSEYLSMPYSGGVRELFEDRLRIMMSEDMENCNLVECMSQYRSQIGDRLNTVRKNYLDYLKGTQLDENCKVIDLGYYGNNQRYLNKLLGLKMNGCYFNVNLSEDNPNTQTQKMCGCFQAKDDLTGAKSEVLKKMIFIESFLTAPYGMVKEIDEEGNFICAEKKQNQLWFAKKIRLNNGVKEFIRDYVEKFGLNNLEHKEAIDTAFVDKYYGVCMSDAIEFADVIKQSFWNDNAMMNRIESQMFY